MAAYATKDDIIDRYGPEILNIAADRDRDQVEDTDTVQASLDDATGEINAWISARYDLPISPVPDVLKSCCVDIAVYKLHITHDILTDERRRRYEDCIELLKAIAAGKASLGLDDPPTSVGGGVTLFGPERLFTRATQRNI
jgi:phage gp36-like protein